MLTTTQAAARLSAKIRTIRKWLAHGRFPNAVKFGRDWLIPESDLEALQRPANGRPKRAA